MYCQINRASLPEGRLTASIMRALTEKKSSTESPRKDEVVQGSAYVSRGL